MAANAVDKARTLLEERRGELRKELDEIEKALGSLGGRRRGPGRPRSTAAAPASKKRRRRRGGTRADHALKQIKKSPGLTASEIAKKLGIKPNYVYRVMGELEKDGKVRKQGRGYHPA